MHGQQPAVLDEIDHRTELIPICVNIHLHEAAQDPSHAAGSCPSLHAADCAEGQVQRSASSLRQEKKVTSA